MNMLPPRRVYSPKREGYGRECDVWSLGVIVFIMLGGRFPFTGATPQEVAQEGLQGRIRFTNTAPWTEVSTEGARVLVRELSKNDCNSYTLSFSSSSAIDLIRCCLDPDPEKRITAAEALKHPVSFRLTPAFEGRSQLTYSCLSQWLLMADGTAKPAPKDYGGARLQRSDTQVTTHDTAGLSLRRTVTQVHEQGSSSDEESTPAGSKDEEQPKPGKPDKAATQRLIV